VFNLEFHRGKNFSEPKAGGPRWGLSCNVLASGKKENNAKGGISIGRSVQVPISLVIIQAEVLTVED